MLTLWKRIDSRLRGNDKLSGMTNALLFSPCCHSREGGNLLLMKRKNSILTVTPNPSIDQLIDCDSVQSGKPYGLRKKRIVAGGKALNVARALRKLDCPVLSAAILGGDSGAWMKRELRKEGIKLQSFEVPEETRTNVTYVGKDGRTGRSMDAGPSLKLKQEVQFRKHLQKLYPQKSFVVFSGRNANGFSDTFYASCIKDAKKMKLSTVLDTHGPSLFQGLKAGPKIVKPNLKEAEQLLNRKLISMKSIKKAVLEIKKFDVTIVILSLGD